MTFFFLMVILGSTDRRAPQGLAPIAGGLALRQLWLFWVAPIVGALLAGVVYRLIAGEKAEAVVKSLGVKPAARSRRR